MEYYFDISYIALGVLGVGLQLCVLVIMSRGAYREFLGIFFYVLVLFLTAVADMSAFFEPGIWGGWYREVFYLNNALRQVSGFIVVLYLFFRATADHPGRGAIRLRLVAATVVLIVAVSLLPYRAEMTSGELPDYFAAVFRNLSFANALVNLVLWIWLVKIRTRDTRLFLVSGGLGINMAGEAIGQSLMSMATSGATPGILFDVGNLIAVLSHLLCLLIWIYTLRRVAAPAARPSRVS